MAYREEIRQAVFDDCKRHASEVDMTEIYPVISELKHAIRDIRTWTRRRGVKTPLALLGSSSSIMHEPKGNVLIVAPWNFPFNLTLAPLASAIAAGNAVILKPSEFTPKTSNIIRTIVEEVFDTSEVAMVEGGVETSQYLLSKKFDHIFFTGSPQVGKIVMKAASDHLCSVTLELGGKSPTIVDQTADVNKSAKRIAWGKFVNNGQICIAPDYILVHKSKHAELIDKLKYHLDQFYGDNVEDNSSYSRIINSKHFTRIKSYLDDAINKGAEIVYGGRQDLEECFMAPTLVDKVDLSSQLMTEEIFGPILPIIPYDSNDEMLKIINEREKPLALYIYSRSKKNINHILNNTSAGASCINHNGVHFYNTNMPFGGVNNSGIGKAHGFDGFLEFSNARGLFKQNMPNALELLVPPYNDFKQKLIDLTLKYF